jgi:pimeloyl-ACP methyl ester carboxylesterase
MVNQENLEYDEFAFFHENAEEFGLPYSGPPVVERVDVEVEPGRRLSALKWGQAAPELVLIHGGAQNAHTWDTVAMALGVPLLAVDMPGHGHSDGWRTNHLDVGDLAADVAEAVATLAPDARAVVGMSLGGMTALGLADTRPELVRRLVLVDVTPGVNRDKSSAIAAFVNGPASFASFDDLLARTVTHNPTRSVSSLRRGILHNAVRQPDGSWVWRYRRFEPEGERGGPIDRSSRFGDLWETVSRLQMPLMLVRGMAAGSVVDDADEAELLRRQPGATVAHVEGAGHSVQGDQPVELARLIETFTGVTAR